MSYITDEEGYSLQQSPVSKQKQLTPATVVTPDGRRLPRPRRKRHSTCSTSPSSRCLQRARVAPSHPEDDLQRVIIVMGESRVGKTAFLENLDTKGSNAKVRSFGLQYSYTEVIYRNQNILVNFYEVSGGIRSSHLMQYPLSAANIGDASVFLLVDCSSVESAFNHLELYLPEIVAQLEKKAEQLGREGRRDVVEALREKRAAALRHNPE